MDKEELTANELLEKLRKSGRRHVRYFHYTTRDVLEKMLKGKRFLFAPLCDMNDGRESDVVPKNLFGMCFSYGAEESVAMWNTYGIPRKSAVRLCFDGASIRSLLDAQPEKLKYWAVDGDNKIIDAIPSDKIKLFATDIAYALGPKGTHAHYKERDVYVTDSDGNHISLYNNCFSGYVKMGGWSYEREARLIIRIDKRYRVPGLNKIALDASSVIDGIRKNAQLEYAMTITLGPWTKPSMVDGLARKGLNANASDFIGYLDKLKTICDKCDADCRKDCTCPHKQ